MVSQQVVHANWSDVKGEILTKWEQVTDHDLTSFKGSVTELVGIIQQKTGHARETIEHELNQIIAGGSVIMSRAAETVSEVVQQTGERFHDGYEYAAYQADEAHQQAEAIIKSRPIETAMILFGGGVAVGVLIGLTLRR